MTPGTGLAIVLALGAGFTGLLFCLTASDRTRLQVAAFLAVPQVFVGPLGTMNLPLSQCWTLLIAACWLVERKELPVRDPIFRCFLLLALAEGLAIAWSPDPMVGVLEVMRLVSFAFLYLFARRVHREDPLGLSGPLRIVLGWAVLNAVVVWVFRLVPAIESGFLSSPLAPLIIGPNTIAAYFGDSPNNVSDVAKAGGFFINANVASMFLGVSTFAFLALGVGLRGRARRWVALGAITTWSATFATGSKTAAALALALPVLIRGVQLLGKPAARSFLPQALALLGLGVWLVPVALEKWVPGYATASAESLESRQPMWDFATRMFKEHLVLGLGHGGWNATIEEFSALGFDSLPPHNLFISMWAAAGMGGVAALALLAVTILVILVRQVIRRAGTPLARRTAFTLGAFAWVVIHGMGDNTTIYGESKTMIILALLFALISAAHPLDHVENERPLDATPRDPSSPDGSAVRAVHPGAGVRLQSMDPSSGVSGRP